jgi:ribonuclease D
VRDAAAARLDLDPGVLCSRERLESVARLKPTAPEALAAVPDLRRWQIGVLGDAFVRALAEGSSTPVDAGVVADDPTSPYRPG